MCHGGPGSVVGIATGYGLDGPGIESRRGARFSAPVQTCPGAHPASCTMGTESFPGVKSSPGVTLTPHPLLVPWSRKSTGIPLLPLRAVRPVNGYRVFPGGKERPECDADPSPPSSAVVKKEYGYTSTHPMGRTACTEPQCLYKGALTPAMHRTACTEPQCLYKSALYLYLLILRSSE